MEYIFFRAYNRSSEKGCSTNEKQYQAFLRTFQYNGGTMEVVPGSSGAYSFFTGDPQPNCRITKKKKSQIERNLRKFFREYSLFIDYIQAWIPFFIKGLNLERTIYVHDL